MVKCYRIKGDEFALEINENRILLSHPQIELHNEYRCRDKNDIMYFYYHIKIQKKVKTDSCDEWSDIASEYVTEMGAIPYLEDTIDSIIKLNPDETGYKEYLYNHITKTESDTNYISSYEVSCTRWLEEDSYIIRKNHKHTEDMFDDAKDDIWYSIYIGIGNEISSNTTGIRCSNLTEGELLTIKSWAKQIMDYVIEEEKINARKRCERDSEWFQNHLKNKYPDDYPNWMDIFIKLNSESFILEEYQAYVSGKKIDSTFFSKWQSKNPMIAQELIRSYGVKDWLAYIILIKYYQFYHYSDIFSEEDVSDLPLSEEDKQKSIEILKEFLQGGV